MSNHRLRESTRAHFTYRGDQLNEISFPLGGIGTGSIGLAGNGRLIDWEIFNRPNKGSVNGFSHFAVKAERDGDVVDARVLHGDLPGPLSGSLRSTWLHSYGFGPTRASLGGLPHFAGVEFEGTFPVATLSFADARFPGAVSLRAFNPFIPGNSGDSSIPAACFEVQIANTGDDDLHYTVALAVTNPAGPGKSVNRARRDGATQLLTLGTTGVAAEHPGCGDLTVATDCPDVSFQEYWFRGAWFDDLTIYWHDFTTPGGFVNRSYAEPTAGAGGGFGRDDTAVLAARIGVAAGTTRAVRFVLAWSFPNCVNYWHPVGVEQEQRDAPPPEFEAGEWRNWYATRFADSAASAGYCLREWERLRDQTLAFRDALYASSVPPAVLDAAAATLSVLNSSTVLRLEDGTFYGFEGVRVDQGCCEGSCTHVWNYAYALPFLFPDLERSMRDADFRYNAGPDGGMTFRLQLPLGRERLGFRPCADGQFGGVIKAFREWKISGDSEWLRGHWDTIKRNISFAWADSNPDRWDADRDGVLEGRQHHTLDMELFGPNSWLNGFYLAALAAGAEMAEHLGETGTAAEYRALFARGKEWTDRNLFNGEYYQQQIDLTDRSILEAYAAGDGKENYRGGRSQVWNYWDHEHGEIKYQVAEGCAIDQVLAQWHANICGIGDVFDREQTRSALAAIYRHNFMRSLREHFNPARLYGLDDEAGTVICSYPRALPVVPVTYAQETMHGFEYQAAGHLIQEGMLEEGLAMVQAVRDRYDGTRRNPWNEIECGSNYARSMAAFALLLAWSGFEFDAVRRHVGFSPKVADTPHTAFWSLDSGWGTCVLDATEIRLQAAAGELRLSTFSSDRLVGAAGGAATGVQVGGAGVAFRQDDATLAFSEAVAITPGAPLTIALSAMV
ncbi:MAG: GH116 family glycosyl-hydrolase [Spirochaetaceae bacterium]|nr:GH116 family glycosyl-hydrolase [Spirochaetaceae bacterium]